MATTPYLKIVDGMLPGTPNSDDFKTESDVVTDSTSVRGAFKNSPVELAQHALLRISRHVTEVAYDGSRAMLAIVDYCSANTFRKESPELLAKEEAEKAARALKAKKAKKAKDAREARAAAKASEVDEQVAVEDPQAVMATIAVLAAMDAKKSVRELPARRMKELAAKRLEAAKRQGLVDEQAVVVARLTRKLATAAAGDLAQVHIELEEAKAAMKDTVSLLDNSQNRITQLEQLLVVAKQAAAVQAAAEKAERDDDSRDHPEGNRRYPMPDFGNRDVVGAVFSRVVAGAVDLGGSGACRSVKDGLAELEFLAGGHNPVLSSHLVSQPIKEFGNQLASNLCIDMARIRGRMASFLVAAFHHAKLDNSADCKKRFAKRFMTSFLQGVRKVGHMVHGPDKMGKPSVRISYARNSGLVKVAAAAVAKRAADKDTVAAAKAAEVVDKKTSAVDAAFKIGGDATLAQKAKARNAQVAAQTALRVAVAAATTTAFALDVAVAAVPESAKDGLVASLARFAPVAIPEPVATAIAQGVATKTAEAEAAIKKVIKGLLGALNVFRGHHRKQWAALVDEYEEGKRPLNVRRHEAKADMEWCRLFPRWWALRMERAVADDTCSSGTAAARDQLWDVCGRQPRPLRQWRLWWGYSFSSFFFPSFLLSLGSSHSLAPLLPSNWAYTPPALDLPFLLAYLYSSRTGSRSRCFSFSPFPWISGLVVTGVHFTTLTSSPDINFPLFFPAIDQLFDQSVNAVDIYTTMSWFWISLLVPKYKY